MYDLIEFTFASDQVRGNVESMVKLISNPGVRSNPESNPESNPNLTPSGMDII